MADAIEPEEKLAMSLASPEDSVSEIPVQPEPIVTRVTYQTNLPPNQRRASPFQNGKAQQLMQELLGAASPVAPREPLSSANSPTRPEDRVATAPATRPDIPPSQASPASIAPAVEEMAKAPIEADILSGISPRFVPTRLRGVLNPETETAAIRHLTDNPAERPFQAGGPVLRGPEPVSHTASLGNPEPPRGSMLAPVGGEISSGFGWRVDPFTGQRAWHTGVDIKAQPGEAVRAAMAGVVSFAGPHPELGNLIVVDHGEGLTTYYGHNQNLQVQAGQRVESGMELANAGASGRAAGPHVHFEVRRGELALNPEPLLRQSQNHLTAAR